MSTADHAVLTPFEVLADYERQSLAHVAGLPEQIDAPGLWRGIGFRVGIRYFISVIGDVNEILTSPPLTQVPGTHHAGATVVETYPQRAVGQHAQGSDVVGTELFAGQRFEPLEAHAIEAIQPIAGAQPQIAVCSLRERPDVCGRARVDRPHGPAKPGGVVRQGIGTQACQHAKQQDRGGTDRLRERPHAGVAWPPGARFPFRTTPPCNSS